MQLRSFLASLLLVSGAAGADATLAQLVAGGKVLDHKSLIVATQNAHEADTCRGFDLTDSQIRDFFRKAAPMTVEALHANFKWAPCQVLGHILYQDQKLQFVITAASTGQIEVAPGKVIQFGCSSSCAEMFAYGYPVPTAATAPLPASENPH